MVFFFVTTFILAIIGMVAILSVRHWELETGNVCLTNVRPQMSRALRFVSLWCGHILPTLIRIYSRRAWRAISVSAHHTAARVAIKLEQLLEHTLHMVRRTTEIPRGSGEVSAFLREVAEHKKKLLRYRDKKSTIRQ